MFLRAITRIALLFLLLFATVVACAQRPGHGSVSGAVRTLDDHGVADARVELRSLNTGSVVSSTYTSFSGDYLMHEVPNGTYEIVVTNGLSQNTDSVTIQDSMATANFRMAGAREAQPGDAGNRDTVSVAQMKIPDKARDAFHKAQKAFEKQKMEDTLKEVQEALAIAPKFADALTLRALVKLDEQKTDDAIIDLESAVQDDNNYAMAYMVLGSAYNAKQRFDDALRVLDRGVTLQGNAWQGYFEMAKAYLGKRDLTNAMKEVNRAGDLAPSDYAPVHLVRANIYLALSNFSDAMSELETYLQRDPAGPDSAAARKTLEQVKTFVATK